MPTSWLKVTIRVIELVYFHNPKNISILCEFIKNFDSKYHWLNNTQNKSDQPKFQKTIQFVELGQYVYLFIKTQRCKGVPEQSGIMFEMFVSKYNVFLTPLQMALNPNFCPRTVWITLISKNIFLISSFKISDWNLCNYVTRLLSFILGEHVQINICIFCVFSCKYYVLF